MLQGCSSNSTTTPFSILFPMSANMDPQQDTTCYPYCYSSTASSVDCTLSLGPPSARPPAQRSSCGTTTTPSFCWDIITQSQSTTNTSSNSSACSSNLGGDPLLLARRCANCDTTSTPLWRNGPRGPKSLCNACGIRYKKEERRAAASTTTTASANGSESSAFSYNIGTAGNYQRQQQQQFPWSCYSSTGTTTKSGSSWISADQDDHHQDVPSYVTSSSWRLNVVPSQFPAVTDRPSLFQYQ